MSAPSMLALFGSVLCSCEGELVRPQETAVSCPARNRQSMPRRTDSSRGSRRQRGQRQEVFYRLPGSVGDLPLRTQLSHQRGRCVLCAGFSARESTGQAWVPNAPPPWHMIRCR